MVVVSRVLRSLLVTALMLALGGAVGVECLTLDATRSQRACCAAIHHDCGAAAVRMSCCAMPPDTQARVQASATKQERPVLALVTGPLALLPEPHVRLHPVAARSFGREAPKLPDRPRHLRLSVFLI